MVNASALTLILAGPPASPPDFADRLDHVELTHHDDVQLTAYDRDGTAIGTLVMWIDEQDAIHLESDYEDGYASIVVLDETEHRDATLPAAVVAQRAQLMVAWFVATNADAQNSAISCAVSLAGGVAACANGNPLVTTFACPTAIYSAWCTCTPLIIKKRPTACPD